MKQYLPDITMLSLIMFSVVYTLQAVGAIHP